MCKARLFSVTGVVLLTNIRTPQVPADDVAFVTTVLLRDLHPLLHTHPSPS